MRQIFIFIKCGGKRELFRDWKAEVVVKTPPKNVLIGLRSAPQRRYETIVEFQGAFRLDTEIFSNGGLQHLTQFQRKYLK